MKHKNALNVENITKIFFRKKTPALNNISFNVGSGSFHGLIGPNGAGKTTIIKVIIGAYASFKGKIQIFSVDNSSEASKEKISYVPEKTIFPKGFSVYSYLKMTYLLNDFNETREDVNKKIIDKLNDFNIIKLAKSNPNNLSSGEKKKVLLIQALLSDPKIIILDEPASNLDPNSRIFLFKKLKELASKGVTIFISSHVLTEIEKYIDSFTLIQEGKILYTGSVANIKNRNEKINLEKVYLKLTNQGEKNA